MKKYTEEGEVVSAIVNISRDSEIQIQDAVSSGKRVKSITVEIEATHSGFVNGNNWLYTPYALSGAAKSFVSPYLKPVTIQHREDSKTLGRVVESKYVQYDNSPISHSRKTTKRNLQQIKDYVSSDSYGGPGFKGLGHIQLRAKITDAETIDKMLKYKVASVSVGGSASSAYCSICGNNPTSKSCTHTKGATYDGEKCFYIGDSISFNHISYVDFPADKNAISTLIQDAEVHNSHLSILDFEITDKDNGMSIDINDFDKSNEHLVAHAKSLGLKDFELPDTEGYSVLDYVFSEEQTFPIKDKLSALVANDFVKNNIKDSEDKEGILKVISDKLEELGVKDAEQELKEAIEEASKTKEDSSSVKDSQDGVGEKDIAAIVKDAVASAISELIPEASKSNGYLEKRNKVLSDSVKSLTAELADVKSQLKDSLVTQIAQLEGDIDESRLDKLKARTAQSLKDHLDDLYEKQKSENKSDNTTKVSDSQEDNVGEKGSVSITDASDGEGQDSGKDEDKPKHSVSDGIRLEDMTDEEFRKLWENTRREKGAMAAFNLQTKRNKLNKTGA